MPKVVLYVPAALYRQLEELAPVNEYESADDMIRTLSLATLDEVVSGVAMKREVVVGSEAVVGDLAVSGSAVGGDGEPERTASDSHFKPDFKPERKKK